MAAKWVIRKDYSAENFNIIRNIALGLISNQIDFNSSKKLKMKRAALRIVTEKKS
jgi:hypothetical protein